MLTPTHDVVEGVRGHLLSRRPPATGEPTGAMPKLASAEPPGGLAAVLARRRSVRDFAPRPLTPGQVATIIDAAFDVNERIWPEAVHGSHDLTVLVAAFDVSGTPRGVHEYDRGDAGLTLVLADDQVLDALERTYTRAPAILLVCRRSTTAVPPAHDYGATFVRAGSLCHGAWLAALARGLAGSVYGRAVYEVAHAVGDLPRPHSHLFTLAIGHAR